MHLSFQKVFYVIATIVGLFTILILAKAVLIPIAFAFLIAFILFPLTKKLEFWGANETLSAILSILGLSLIVGAAILLFSNQIIQLSENLTDFKVKIVNVFADATLFFNKNIVLLPQLEKEDLFDKIKNWINDSAGALISQTFSSSANFIFGLLTSIVFTFLILIYKKGLVSALVSFFPQEHRKNAFTMFKSVQQVGQQYLFGMVVIVLILGFVNSIGLWIIGIDNPFLFGFLAAVLALIPYAGTFLGSAIPVLYAFISYDKIWMPITIVIFFWLVQLIESNYLTPKIVGGNLKINAFTSIISIIIGASIWGIAGMILFLPFAAMLKTVCEHYIELKPFALLIGEENYNTKKVNDKFTDKLFKKIKNLFSKKHS
ncbi:AI-2E family transporter [Flavobacterium tibetense]|uniref:AI-2E family transporter n=1 Tax=Flavobacterium tibetense TaxID=2233533 RepID=A0A365P009_9FLAO|nr:AI-2E family transporter [Flavobacterium tibetense]RBA27846.1 AI-2E family transporter [Flavobacterium tibetense]